MRGRGKEGVRKEPQTTHSHAHTGAQLFRVKRRQCTKVNFLSLFTRQLGGQRVHLVVWSLCVVALHIHALMWQDLSHTRHMLAVKSVWPCYMANNILVMLAGIQLKSFYP